ncbi:MAG TPA: ABC transporter ATP-binding protein [Bryobacteraceae bacterium]|jgi:ATP-binding cassette, subfamily B, bacterial|nr:ABC transporter ATP-binding protein [Bryobacteraceae bacterium]
MPKDAAKTERKKPPSPGLMLLLKPYKLLVAMLVVLTIVANGLNLVVPKLMSHAIDAYTQGRFVLNTVILQFLVVAALVFVLTYAQNGVQIWTAERVAKDLRSRLAAKISEQSFAWVEQITPAKLLTNLTSDVDAVKLFVSQAIASIISSLFLIAGSSVLLISINWRLALAVLGVVPFIAITFQLVLRKVRTLFKRGQEAIDWLNRVINESILGASLIRLLNTQQIESQKFLQANTEARDIGLSILRLFASLIPAITLAVNVATVIILLLGGHYVIAGTMSLGDFTAFNSYLAILIFPIILIGFMSNVIAQSTASYMRIGAVLGSPEVEKGGEIVADLRGDVGMDHVSLSFGQKMVLKDVSFNVPAGTKTAIIGPTAAGKTQLLYLLIGLLKPTSGTITYDGEPIDAYDKEALHQRVGFVFQDSSIFNLTLRENIAFSTSAAEQDIGKAITTAELDHFIASLPEGLKTVVSERGASLSGGQKQRVMLARALALNPRVLLLDDFTARVDANTERAILENVHRNYPGITLISVTQKIASVVDYDQIILLMEGEVLAIGKHQHLMDISPEYVQLYDSQRSTSHYEVQA